MSARGNLSEAAARLQFVLPLSVGWIACSGVLPHDRQPGEDVYATSRRAPKERLPDGELDPRDAYALVRNELMLDGVSRINLATFCTTWAEPEVHRLLEAALDRNIVDKDEYPQTAELERRCVRREGKRPREGPLLGTGLVTVCAETGSPPY